MDGLIYAYHAPKSSEQRKYTQQRLAELTSQRQRGFGLASIKSAQITTERPSSRSSGRSRAFGISSHYMETLTLHPSTDALSETLSSNGLPEQRSMTDLSESDLLSQPFEFRNGRRYIRGVPYPLPCDLAEINRQNLRTLLESTVFGRPVCAPRWRTETPKRVLDFCCGSGYWSATAHGYFSERGATHVEFTGLDVVPLAPDYRKQGINWNFVQHDFRHLPLPFDDDSFDIVILKDTSLTNPLGPSAQHVLDDLIRIVMPGGTLEIWDSDYQIRCLPIDTRPELRRHKSEEQVLAVGTGTYAVGPGFPFVPSSNKYVQDANAWIEKALGQRRFLATPCAHYAGMLCQEEALRNIEQRRLAVPLGEFRWERASQNHDRFGNGHDSPMSTDSRRKLGLPEFESLTPEQAAIRHAALTLCIQGLETMESILKEASGKTTEEWNMWWTALMSEMLKRNREAFSGECLEFGVWWATKVDAP